MFLIWTAIEQCRQGFLVLAMTLYITYKWSAQLRKSIGALPLFKQHQPLHRLWFLRFQISSHLTSIVLELLHCD